MVPFTIYGLKRRIWHLLGAKPQKILQQELRGTF